MIGPLQAIVLGIIEGLTEYLPVSSTGHLILVSHWLGLHGEAVNTFEVVIQSGAVAAVFGLYRVRVVSMWRGAIGRDPAGRRLLTNLLISVLPAIAAGIMLHKRIEASLFSVWPVVAALAAGGVVMIVLERRLRARTISTRTVETVTWREALLIGLVQCLALWPGTSRAMVTILAAMCCGLPAMAAAEYSFLLALPTLGAATLFDAVHGGAELVAIVDPLSIACGFLAAALVAALVVRGFVHYLTHRGLAPFGWYRLGLAAVVWWSLLL